LIEPDTNQVLQWQVAMHDPFREELLAVKNDFPRRIQQCAEPVRDEPAFDPCLIAEKAKQIPLPLNLVFPQPMLERVVRIGLAHIDATFEGNHPKYGKGIYSHSCHDSFPPVIISVVDALTLWGMTVRAEELFEYWLNTFVRRDGTVNYRGTSLSELGMLLTSALRLMTRGASIDWLKNNFGKLNLSAGHLLEISYTTGQGRLLFGVPEDDEKQSPASYFHNNAWVIRGFKDWSLILDLYLNRKKEAERLRQNANQLQALLVQVIENTWPNAPSDWWLRPTTEKVGHEPDGHPERITATRLGSYTNYRYWPELMSSNILPKKLMKRVVKARLVSGGQFCGTTRFEDHLDDWPLAEWLEGLWNLGLYDDFLLCMWGHIYYHQAQDHLTAYEQVTFPPGRQYKDAAYCLPCQLVAVRAARHLVR
jgi:hypothetical protein